LSLQPVIRTGVIGIGLQATEIFIVQNRLIRLHSITLANDTRPTADPRSCWVHIVKINATTGITIGIGSCSSFNDYILTLPPEFDLNSEERILMEIQGDNLDVYKASLLYTPLKTGES